MSLTPTPSSKVPKARLVFMGSPDFSVPSLLALNNGFDICAIYTQPPRKAGRGMTLQPTAVARCASELGLPCFWPERLRDNPAEIARLKGFHADFFVVIAYGLILPQSVLDIPRLGCINGHASLLPRWRGAAPIQRAIEAGDSQTGVSIMQMEAGLDTGPVLMTEKIKLADNVTSGQLHDTLSHLSARLLVDTIKLGMAGQLTPTPQPEEGVCYANKISNAETMLNFALPADIIARKILAFSPFPGTSISSISGRLKLLSARALKEEKANTPPHIFLGRTDKDGIKIACGNHTVLEISHLQPAGKKPMSAGAFLNGQSWQIGQNIFQES